jgi:hypothetical protein
MVAPPVVQCDGDAVQEKTGSIRSLVETPLEEESGFPAGRRRPLGKTLENKVAAQLSYRRLLVDTVRCQSGMAPTRRILAHDPL